MDETSPTAIRQPPRRPRATCSSCGAVLDELSYRLWGTMKFDRETGLYADDDSWGKSDMELSCPHCSLRLAPEGLIF